MRTSHLDRVMSALTKADIAMNDKRHAASSMTCFVELSITMGVSKYWNSGWHPKVDWIRF